MSGTIYTEREIAYLVSDRDDLQKRYTVVVFYRSDSSFPVRRSLREDDYCVSAGKSICFAVIFEGILKLLAVVHW